MSKKVSRRPREPVDQIGMDLGYLLLAARWVDRNRGSWVRHALSYALRRSGLAFPELFDAAYRCYKVSRSPVADTADIPSDRVQE